MDRDKFIEIVQDSVALPEEVRLQAPEVYGIHSSRFDQTYMEFLDEQIQLAPRGPEWTEVLLRRRKGLEAFCDVELLTGYLREGTCRTLIKIDPSTNALAFWEQLEMAD